MAKPIAIRRASYIEADCEDEAGSKRSKRYWDSSTLRCGKNSWRVGWRWAEPLPHFALAGISIATAGPGSSQDYFVPIRRLAPDAYRWLC